MNIYIMDVTIPPIEFFLPRVSGERIERMKQYKFEIDRRRGLAAETLLNFGLKRLCSGLSVPVTIKRDENGKPHIVLDEADKRLLRSAGVLPADRESIDFSLSHSGDYAICAIAGRETEEIGVDIEEHRRDSGKIAEHFFCEGENARIQNAEDFYMYWTLKESFIKAVGLGLKLSLNSFEAFPKGDLAEYKHSVNESRYVGRVYRPYPGYTVSVCARGDEAFPAVIENVDNII